MLALLTVPVKTMVSAPTPDVRVSTVLRVAVLAALPRVRMKDTLQLHETTQPMVQEFFPIGVTAD